MKITDFSPVMAIDSLPLYIFGVSKVTATVLSEPWLPIQTYAHT
ncbi:MAG: hypothetical protein WBG90_13185 [Saonia sp.]